MFTTMKKISTDWLRHFTSYRNQGDLPEALPKIVDINRPNSQLLFGVEKTTPLPNHRPPAQGDVATVARIDDQFTVLDFHFFHGQANFWMRCKYFDGPDDGGTRTPCSGRIFGS